MHIPVSCTVLKNIDAEKSPQEAFYPVAIPRAMYWTRGFAACRNRHCGGQSRGHELDILKLPRPNIGRGDDAKIGQTGFGTVPWRIWPPAMANFSLTGVGCPLVP